MSRKKVQHVGKILFSILSVLLGFLGILLFTSSRWMLATWAHLDMEELVYHLKAPLEGTSKDKAAGDVPSGTFIDNGSGLSRKTRITAETMGRVLNYGFRSYVMPEFMASLPLAGFDGTMKKRGMAVGSAHVKTGLIRDVRSIAGYVTDVNARRWSVVVMMNGKRLDGDRIF